MRRVVIGMVLALLATVSSAATDIRPAAAAGTKTMSGTVQFPVRAAVEDVWLWGTEPGLHGLPTTYSTGQLESVYEDEFNAGEGETIGVFRWCAGDTSCQTSLFGMGRGDRRHLCYTSAGRFCSRS